MNKDDVIRMARKAGCFDSPLGQSLTDGLERFAALVAAAKDAEHKEAMRWDIHSCGPTCTRYACVATREAVAAEREACARIAEEPSATTYECTVACGGPAQTFTQRFSKDATEIAKAIRARGQA